MAIAQLDLNGSQRDHIAMKVNRKDHWEMLAIFVGLHLPRALSECMELDLCTRLPRDPRALAANEETIPNTMEIRYHVAHQNLAYLHD